MTKNRKNYRLPWVLEIGEPKGGSVESRRAQEEWEDRAHKQFCAEFERFHDLVMREQSKVFPPPEPFASPERNYTCRIGKPIYWVTRPE